MAKYTAITPIRHDGINYASGEPIELDEDLALRFANGEMIEADDDGNPVVADGSSRTTRKRQRTKPAKKSVGKKPDPAAKEKEAAGSEPDPAQTENKPEGDDLVSAEPA